MAINGAFDVAIVGAGVAGLTLAERIARKDINLRIALVGPIDNKRQRLSFWAPSATLDSFRDHDLKTWSSWCFNHAKTGSIGVNAKDYLYASMDGCAYKEDYENKINRRVHRVFDSCDEITSQDESFHRILCSDQTIEARVVVDTRPPLIPKTTLKQQFWGVTVTCPKPHGFDSPMLMDFDVTPITNQAITFIYVIPLNATALLVEATTFAYDILPLTAYQRCVSDWLSMRLDFLPNIETSEEEQGVLPMGRILPQAGAQLHCGMSGGSARMSTGYSFVGIQRQTRYLAKALTTGNKPETQIPYSIRAQWMDRVFLEVARRNPRSLIDLFMRMASALDGDDFAKFMSDQGGLIPCIKTILAAPKQPFIQALGRMARA